MLKKLIAENLYKWQKQALASPTQISITPTNLCNLKCQSCWQRDLSYSLNSNNKAAEISEQKLCDIVKEAGELGVRCIELTGGGEPFARKSTTVMLIKQIKKNNMIGWMTSNGTLLSPDIIKLMVSLGWDKLTISLDGHDADTNDFLRPPKGTFEKINNALILFNEYKRMLKKDKPEITLNVVISNYNMNKLSKIAALGSSLGIQGITFEPIKVLANQCKQLLIDFEHDYDIVIQELKNTQQIAQRSSILTNIDNLISSPELIRYSGKLANKIVIEDENDKEGKLVNSCCFEPWFHIYLETDGNVRPCCVTSGLGENINNKSLKDIWFGDKFSSFRDAIANKDYPLSCNQCNANLISFSKELRQLFRERLKNTVTGNIEQPDSKRGPRLFYFKKKQVKLLIADTATLYPPLWGGPKRIWGLYSNFSQELFDITYVGVDFRFDKTKKYSFKRIKDNFKEISCAFPPHYYFWHIIENNVFRNTSLDLFVYLWMHTDWQFKYILDSQNADILICSHPWAALSMRKNPGQFFIYDAHNCEYLLMDKILGKHILRNFILKQVRKIEQDACNKSDLILACSENEKRDLISLYKINPDKIIITTNGTNIPKWPSRLDKEKNREDLEIPLNAKVIIFIAAYYKPNIDAARFILESLASKLNEFMFVIVGSVSDAFEKKEIPPNIRFLGQVTDDKLNLALEASDIAINPIFDGSGINIKMLDYMSYGLPIVTTECGARGIATAGKRPMVVSAPECFIDNIKMIAADNVLYKQLSQDGRSMAKDCFDWVKISANLQGVILDTLGINE